VLRRLVASLAVACSVSIIGRLLSVGGGVDYDHSLLIKTSGLICNDHTMLMMREGLIFYDHTMIIDRCPLSCYDHRMIITVDRWIDNEHKMLILGDDHGGGHQGGGPVSQPPSSRLCFCGVCRCLPGRLALSRCLYPYQRTGCLRGEDPLPPLTPPGWFLL